MVFNTHWTVVAVMYAKSFDRCVVRSSQAGLWPLVVQFLLRQAEPARDDHVG